MDVKARNFAGNRGGFTKPKWNVFHRNTDPPKKSSNFCPRNNSSPKIRENGVCKYWMSGRCARGDKCRYSHSWSRGDGSFAMITKLLGHNKAIRGIALPSGSDMLYSGSSDGTARIWDCNTGQCAHLANLGGEVGSLITEGHWVFIGMKNVVKALNTQTENEFSLKGPVGQVYAMVVAGDMLYAGAQNGAIFAWRGSVEANTFLEAGLLEGHTGAVLCLTVGDKKLFSGSVDQTIRMWDIDTLHCIQTLNGHADAVMSLVHWNGHLFSCSLDCTIKVWFAAEGQNWEVIHTHKEEKGVLTLCGMIDAETKPVLFCSCNDDTVRLYELPLFNERGRLFSKREVRVIERGPNGLFFTGDATGSLTVWTWLQEPQGGDS